MQILILNFQTVFNNSTILTPSVIVILRFITTYSLSEITSKVQSQMAQAIIKIIGLELAASLVLNFTEIDVWRRQQRRVLVDVCLLDFKGSTAVFMSRLTERNINEQMLSLGLRSVQIVEIQGSQGSSSTTNTVTHEDKTGANNIQIAIIVGIVGCLALIAGSTCFWYWRRSNKRQQTLVSRRSDIPGVSRFLRVKVLVLIRGVSNHHIYFDYNGNEPAVWLQVLACGVYLGH